MKRIGILTAGGDTPALNATLLGAVHKANELHIDLIGLQYGFRSLYSERVPHVHLNPNFEPIPELDATAGGTILGSSRKYVDESNPAELNSVFARLSRLRLDGLVCVGGDGTLNGLQPLCACLPTVLAPKTIDNDLGLNYPGEPAQWNRVECAGSFQYSRTEYYAGTDRELDLQAMVNYVTPGYATAVFVAADGVRRVRTTAESHRRIAIVEVMGRHSGFLAVGASYGQPDIVLIPEVAVDIQTVASRIEEICGHQQHAVIVCGEGIVNSEGVPFGNAHQTSDPAGNQRFAGAAENLKQALLDNISHTFLRELGQFKDPDTAIFTRKVGHTQRGGRPLIFDRFHATQLGAHAIEMLIAGENNSVATLQWKGRDLGFQVESHDAGEFRDAWGEIHPRMVHPAMYISELLRISETGQNYLLPIFQAAIGADDMESVRQSLFDSGNLVHPYQSVNVHMKNRIQFLE